MKKIIASIVAAVLILGAAGAGAFFLIRKNAAAEAEPILSNTLRDMFGEFSEIFPRQAEEDGADRQRSVHAELTLPKSLLGLSYYAKITADLWEQQENSTVSATLKTGRNSIGIKVGTADGRTDVALTAGEHQYALGFDVKGIGEALDKSWMNPDVNPDAPFDADAFRIIRRAFEKIEKAYDELLKSLEPDAEDSEKTTAFAERVKKLKEDILALPDVRTERKDRKKGTASLIIDISTADVADAVKYISEFLEEEDVKEFLSGKITGALTGEDKTAEPEGIPDVEDILREIEDSGIEVQMIVEIAEKRIESLNINAKYMEKEAGDGASDETKDVSVRLVVSTAFRYAEKKIDAEVTEYRDGQKADTGTFGYSSEQNDAEYIWTLEAAIREKDAEEDVKHTVCAKYAKADGAFTVNVDDKECATGHYTSKDGTVSFSLEKVMFHYDEDYFAYGVGMKTEKKSVRADDLLTLTISRDNRAKTDVPRGDNLVSLTEEKRSELFGENGIPADVTAFIQSVSDSAHEANFLTADGIRVSPQDKAQARSRVILNSYLSYVNYTLGSKAFTPESAYVRLYDEHDSKLYYLIDASSGTAYINACTSIDPETAKHYHEGSLNMQNQLTLHIFEDSKAEVPCGEPIYRLKTCNICGLQLREYIGGTAAHEYKTTRSLIDSAILPGTKVDAEVRECKKCGELVIDCQSEGYTLSFAKTEKGYEAKELLCDRASSMTNQSTVNVSHNAFSIMLPPGYSGEKIIGIGEDFCSLRYGNGPDTVIIGEGAEYIGPNAFACTYSIREMVLPASLKTIQSGAFHNCDGLQRILFTGTEAQWKAIDKGDNGILLAKLPVIFNFRTENYETLYENFIAPSDYLRIHQSMLSLEKKSAQNLSSLVAGTSGTTVLKIHNTSEGNDVISCAAADDKNGTVIVGGVGKASAYNRSGKNIGNFEFSDYTGVAAGEGYIFTAEYEGGWGYSLVIRDSGTLKTVQRIDVDSRDYGTDFKYPCIANGKVYLLSTTMLLEITISDGSIRTFTEFNNQYEMAYDRSRERLVLRYSPGNSNDTEWYFYDPAGDTAASVKGPRRAFYMTADGNGVRAFNIQSGWAVINGKQTDIETAFDCEITPDGYSYLATEPTEVAKGYIADRVIYRGTDCTVYTAHNAKNTACTVFVYQGKTKVLPVVLHDVENLGNGVFALWKNHGGSDAYYGREAILVNVNT